MAFGLFGLGGPKLTPLEILDRQQNLMSEIERDIADFTIPLIALFEADEIAPKSSLLDRKIAELTPRQRALLDYYTEKCYDNLQSNTRLNLSRFNENDVLNEIKERELSIIKQMDRHYKKKHGSIYKNLLSS